MTIPPRILLHHPDGTRTPVEPGDVYLLEAESGDTRVRTRGAEVLLDVRHLGELLPRFEPYGFLQIHRSYAVNLARIRRRCPCRRR